MPADVIVAVALMAKDEDYTEGEGIADLEEARANARLIVRAVNAHDALVAALREALGVVESRWGCDPTCAIAAAWREARLAEWHVALKLAEPQP